MLDVVIGGGLIVDGQGGKPYHGDVGISQGRIVALGDVPSPAHRRIAVDGALVTPGFIDIHTHYDGQVLWDDTLDPSFSHGVTTALAGNCGVGFAPVWPEHRQRLIELMSGVEDIPGLVLDEGLDWEWRSFGDYLNRIAARRYALDVGTHVTHAPLRVFVMGERAFRDEPASVSDIGAMSDLVREAMTAGAVGFSTGRFIEHRSTRGATVPGTYAAEDEILALAGAMGEERRGVFQVVLRGTVGGLIMSPGLTREERQAEHRLLEAVARRSARPVTYGVAEFPSDPEDIFMMADASERANERGLHIYPQVSPRGTGQINQLEGYHAFFFKPTYNALRHLPLRERVRAMRASDIRARILTEADEPGPFAVDPMVVGVVRQIKASLADSYILDSPLDFEPGVERQIGTLSRALGKTAEEYVYDHYVAGDGTNFNVSFAMNYVHRSLDPIERLLGRAHVISGLGDGGAHMKLIVDAANPTFQLAFWARERKRGNRLALSSMVQKQTGAAAALYGLNDRGVIALGRRADLNVIDFDRLTLKMPRMAYDLPSGGSRLLQESEGYLATMVNGVVTRERDQDTGARPGRLVRLNTVH
jgi:N-acyl-D-amino-acid deacylase